MNDASSSLEFQDHFHLSPPSLKKILDLALSRGGDFSEIYLEHKTFHFIKMEEDIIKETSESIGLGAGIRVISEGQTGYGYTNDLSFNTLQKTAKTAAVIAAAKTSGVSRELASSPSFQPDLYPVVQPAHSEPLKHKIALVEQAYRAAQRFDPRIKKVRVGFSDQIQHTLVANSEGLLRKDTKPLVKLVCFAIAEGREGRESGYSGGGGRVGLEYFRRSHTPEQIGREAAQEAIQLLSAVQPPAGEMPVVLAPGHSGVLIHEAVGHLLEADFNRKKTSVFWNKMGKKVGNEQVQIYDDPTLPHFRGSYNMDDEGTIPGKTALIRAGKVAGLLQDRLSARIMSARPTGHGRRQDYSCIPIPRMSNTYIDRGEYAPEEILGSVKRGFYALHYQGGQVEDSGKFTFSVSSGYLIEEGRLTAPVKQATLIGSNLDILLKIDRVGSDLAFGLQTGTCGKEGQHAPVTDGCPTLRITEMTVGGQR
jgi:TldD protein